MFTKLHTPRRAEGGFTLVELAIVMVIIGLLIAGLLKGQELIANARVTSTVSQIKSVDAALNSFQDKYNVLPGDMASPSTRLANCTATPCSTAGTGGTLGNGQIEGGAVIAAPIAVQEAGLTFVQLAASDLISGVVSSGGLVFGGVLPTVPLGGGMWIAYTGAAIGLGTPATTLGGNRHYAVLAGSVVAPGGATGLVKAIQAAQVDRKLDDGGPTTGTIQTFGNNCVTSGTTNVYTESSTGGTCTVIARVLN